MQDIVTDYEIKLDWFFKTSLIHDIVKVSVSNLLMNLTVSYDIHTCVKRLKPLLYLHVESS